MRATKQIGIWNRGRTSLNKGKKFPAEPLTDDETKRLIKVCSRRAPTGVRNAALIVVLWRSGLRISEALSLYPKDLDAARGTIRVLHGKGNKARTVGLDPESWAVIERWFDKRRALKISGKALVFCTLDGAPIHASYVRALLPRLARRAGIEKRVHPHALRHSHATELLHEGINVDIISKQLGHSSIATTARYLDHISPVVVVETMKGRTWTL